LPTQIPKATSTFLAGAGEQRSPSHKELRELPLDKSLEDFFNMTEEKENYVWIMPEGRLNVETTKNCTMILPLRLLNSDIPMIKQFYLNTLQAAQHHDMTIVISFPEGTKASDFSPIIGSQVENFEDFFPKV
jgi:hypothetical protein